MGVTVKSARRDADSDHYEESAEKRSPFRLAWRDVKLLWHNKQFLPDVFLPLKLPYALPGVTFNIPLAIRDYVLTGVLAVLEIPLLLLALPAFFSLPGWLFTLLFAVYSGFLYLLGRVMWNTKTLIATSNASLTKEEIEKFKAERWVFINGIATSYGILQQSCDLLSATFKREIVGVHNRSFGVIGDLVECIVQRSFNYETEDVRVAYEAVKAQVEDAEVKKVVVIAHSQGGILISMVLDRLYAQVPIGMMSKLEIYTFGSAAACFNNPVLALSDKQRISVPDHLPQSPVTIKRHPSMLTPNAIEQPDRAIPIVEHYCNEYDLVPRWGVLYHMDVPSANATNYNGRVFIHEKATGHLFDQHYLEAMFPLDKLGSDDPSVFWNHRVDNDEQASILRSRTFPRKTGNDPSAKSSAGAVGAIATNGESGSDAWPKEMLRGSASGLRVKDLSRLWRYMDGGTGGVIVENRS